MDFIIVIMMVIFWVGLLAFLSGFPFLIQILGVAIGTVIMMLLFTAVRLYWDFQWMKKKKK